MKKISNYADLIAERGRIEGAIAEQQRILHGGMRDLKENVEPLLQLLRMFGNKNDGRSLLKSVVGNGIDILFGQSKLTGLVKLLIPFLTKILPKKESRNYNE